MKKIGLLMATLTAVTVGGVYAVWTYAEKDVTNITSEEQVIQIAGIDTSEVLKVGSLAIKASDDFSLMVDAASYVYDDYADRGLHQHEAVLVVKGNITVTFTAAAEASDDIQSYGLLTNVYFSSPKNIDLSKITWPIDGNTPIFTFNSLERQLGGANDLADGDDAAWTKSTNADGLNVFTYTFETTEIQKLFTLAEDIVLDTSEKHAAFEAEVAGVSATLHVEQVKASN